MYLDLDLCRVSFATNGAMMEWLPLPTHPSVGLYPAASLMTFQHVRFNFGNEPYQHPPPAGYQDLNQVGSMTSEEKRIVPRLVMLQQLRDELEEEEISGATCQICFAATANGTPSPARCAREAEQPPASARAAGTACEPGQGPPGWH